MKNIFGYLMIFIGFICFLSGCSDYEETGSGIVTAAFGSVLMWIGYNWSDMPEKEA